MTKRIPFITDELAEYIGTNLTIDVDQVLEAASEALTEPSDSYWNDSDLWDTKTMMFATPDPSITSDYAEGTSNYRSIHRDIKDVYPGQIREVTFGHWTHSRFIALEVQVIDDNGAITECFAKMTEIAMSLDDYPLYDEDDYFSLCYDIEQDYIAEIADEWGIALEDMHELVCQDIVQISGAPNDLVADIPGFTSTPGLPWDERTAEITEYLTDILDKQERERLAVAAGQTPLW